LFRLGRLVVHVLSLVEYLLHEELPMRGWG